MVGIYVFWSEWSPQKLMNIASGETCCQLLWVGKYE